mmetsp:Transcript_1408/g.3233  ORF Transcript_1408/g.3233 Transcript_1408/m.3233 type:complete len:227 (-) Transcript_1408:2321-3001(-)
MTFGPVAVIIRPAKRQPMKGLPSARRPSMVGMRISFLICSIISGLTTGVGAKAPMPPVLGPRSPSKIRLWSWAGGSTAIRLPSQSAKMEHSGPNIRSSRTTSAPASPNFFASRHSRTAALASSAVSGTTTPLPAARPLALTTTSKGTESMYFNAASTPPFWAEKVWYSAVGMLWRFMKSLAKALDASICAAALLGPKTGMSSARSWSARPSASICSGPTTTRPTSY